MMPRADADAEYFARSTGRAESREAVEKLSVVVELSCSSGWRYVRGGGGEDGEGGC